MTLIYHIRCLFKSPPNAKTPDHLLMIGGLITYLVELDRIELTAS